MGSCRHQMEGMGITILLVVLSVRPGRVANEFNDSHAFILSLLAPLSLPCVSTLTCELDLSHAAPGPTPHGPLSHSSHAYAFSACHTQLIDIPSDDYIEDSTLLEMATSHDEYQAEIEVAIYDKIQTKLNGRLVRLVSTSKI
jgi:hypothetical protein